MPPTVLWEKLQKRKNEMISESGIRRIVKKDSRDLVTREVFTDELRALTLITIDYEYDTDGRITEETHKDDYGNAVILRYFYGKDKRYFAFEEKELDKNGQSFACFTEHFYDDNGRAIKKNARYGTVEYEYVTSYIYGDNGKPKKSITKSEDETKICEYDENGNITAKFQYTPEDRLFRKTLFSYNGKGLLIWESEHSDKGVEKNCCYSYDENGFRIKERIEYLTDKNKSPYVTEEYFIKDSEGRIIRSVGSSSDFDKTLYFYNAADRLTVMDLFSEKDGSFFHTRHVNFGRSADISATYRYEYDENGCLISQSLQLLDGTEL